MEKDNGHALQNNKISVTISISITVLVVRISGLRFENNCSFSLTNTSSHRLLL